MTNTNSNNEIVRYPVLIPNTIELDTLLLQHPLTNVPNAKDYLLYILSRIKVQHDFTFLPSTELQKIVDNYAPLLHWLIERNILECDNIYKPDQKSKGYKYTSAHLTEPKEEYILKKTLIRRITRQNINSSSSELIINSPVSPVVETINYGSGYGYEAVWVKPRVIARELGLKPNKMKTGLRHFKLISDSKYYHFNNDPNEFFCYLPGEVRGYTRFSLRINEGFIEKIRILAAENPEWFPKK